MACRYEKERLKEKKIEKISKISESLRTNPKNIKKISLRRFLALDPSPLQQL